MNHVFIILLFYFCSSSKMSNSRVIWDADVQCLHLCQFLKVTHVKTKQIWVCLLNFLQTFLGCYGGSGNEAASGNLRSIPGSKFRNHNLNSIWDHLACWGLNWCYINFITPTFTPFSNLKKYTYKKPHLKILEVGDGRELCLTIVQAGTIWIKISFFTCPFCFGKHLMLRAYTWLLLGGTFGIQR